MKEALILIAVLVGLIAVIVWRDKHVLPEAPEFSVLCLDNVSYWYKKNGFNTMLTAKIDKETLKPETCS